MASLTTKKNYKEKYVGNGKIKRSWDEVTHVEEIVDAVTGKQKREIVSGDIFPKRKKKDDMRKTFIERLTKAVQDFEVPYSFGNTLIGWLRDFKVRDKVDGIVAKKIFIAGKSMLEAKYDYMERIGKIDKLKVRRKKIELLNEIVQNIDNFKLDNHWKQKIEEEYQLLKSIKL